MLFNFSSTINSLLKAKSAYARNIKGNVGTVLAFSILPIAGVTGAGLDFSRAVETRTQLQHASDAAALAGGRTLQDDGLDYKTRARKSFDENYKNASFANKVSFNIKKITDGVRVDVTAKMDTTLLAIVGYKTIDLSVFSEIGVSDAKLEVALVLDNTGSMSGQKIATLKQSANGKELKTAFQNIAMSLMKLRLTK